MSAGKGYPTHPGYPYPNQAPGYPQHVPSAPMYHAPAPGAPPAYPHGPPPPYSQNPMQAMAPQPHPMYHPQMQGYPPHMQAYQPQQQVHHYMMPQQQTVLMPGGYDAGARFAVGGAGVVPPAPPGCAPNAAQMAAASGQNVVVTQKPGNFMTGGSDGGYTVW